MVSPGIRFSLKINLHTCNGPRRVVDFAALNSRFHLLEVVEKPRDRIEIAVAKRPRASDIWK